MLDEFDKNHYHQYLEFAFLLVGVEMKLNGLYVLGQFDRRCQLSWNSSLHHEMHLNLFVLVIADDLTILSSK
ncbi:hypothetical protein D3C78_1883670 [compost metagenome]